MYLEAGVMIPYPAGIGKGDWCGSVYAQIVRVILVFTYFSDFLYYNSLEEVRLTIYNTDSN